MSTRSLYRYLQIRGPVLLGLRDWRRANQFVSRTCHGLVAGGCALWAWGVVRTIPELSGAGLSLVLGGFVARGLTSIVNRTMDLRSNQTITVEPAVQNLIARLADSYSGTERLWSRVVATPGAPNRLARMLHPHATKWLEHGAEATLRVLATIERLGPDHLFVRRSQGELEWAVDYGMTQLFRYAHQVERFPDLLEVVTPDAHLAVQRLERLANLVDHAVSPFRDMAETISDPLERAVEDLALETLVRVEL